MKLASLKNPDSRDGTLIVVSKDLKSAVNVEGTIPTLQKALENWREVSPELDEVSGMLNAGEARDAFALDVKKLASPLPRAYQWLDGSAYVNHVELVRKSRGVPMPESFWTDPLMYQGESDWLLGPCDDIPVSDEKFGIDFEGEVAIVTDDVPMGVTPADAAKHIKLIMLVNDVSLRYLAMPEIAKGFGFLQAKPATTFSPVAVTPEELGNAWKDGKVHLPLMSYYNGKKFGSPNAGIDMVFNFPQLVAHAARTRFLSAGTIIGSGTVSNKDRSNGSSCIVEKRTLEKLETGESTTPFMSFGDIVKIEMCDAKSQSIFGAIEQRVVKVSMKLYGYWRSSTSYRVRIALALKGLTPEIIPVNLLKAKQGSAYAKINPEMRLPTLIDGEYTLTQSLAIIEYLDEKFPEPWLLPLVPHERARARALALAVACDISPLNTLGALSLLTQKFGFTDEQKNEWVNHWMVSGFAALEQMLLQSPYTGSFCHGAAPGMADCCLVPQVYNARRFNINLTDYPTILRIDAACAKLPAFIAAHPNNQPDAV